MTSTQWVEYHVGTKRKSYNSLPTSNITAEAVSVDGFTLSQTDNAGVTTAAVGNFTPTFDADGNQTLAKTSTGIWSVTYDAENRPVTFTNAESSIVVECAYDSMGRRATKKVTIDGEVTLHQCYIYCGYLQIACCDLSRSNHPALWLITWDPTQPIAIRPLAIQKDGAWYTYGWDLTKNICELYGTNGYIRTAYTYSPYGEVTESGNTWQPIQWSSEYNETELGLLYYNYRHYNPMDGRWLGRDLLNEYYEKNLYSNQSVKWIDRLGLYPVPLSDSDFNPEWSPEERKNDGRNIYGLTQIETKYILDELYISSDLIEGCPFFIFHKTLEAQKLGIKVTIYMHPKNYKDRKGRTPLEHEQMHVKIIAEEWNSFIASAELHVGWYESYKAYKLAHPNETIGSLMLKYHNNITNRNANLDRESYWS